jgi:hypothetical protein
LALKDEIIMTSNREEKQQKQNEKGKIVWIAGAE